jgi:Domain of unknown function (DUF5655)/Domain of unknown function (DUF4287)
VKIRLQYFDGCPTWKVMEQRLAQALVEAQGAGAEMVRERVESPEEAVRLGFRGSPTVLVDGKDPFASERDAVGLACRVYRTANGEDGLPTAEELRAALAGACPRPHPEQRRTRTAGATPLQPRRHHHANAEEGIQSQLRNIERTYGRSIDDLVADVAGSGLTKHSEVVAMLKQSHGMAHGAAHRVSLVARDRLAGRGSSVSAAPPPFLQAVYEEVMQTITPLGEDIERAPKKGYVSLRRRKQFAMLQPRARWVNLGLILPGVEPGGRLESADKWNALFTHRVRVASVAEIDDEVRAWLRDAYLAAG